MRCPAALTTMPVPAKHAVNGTPLEGPIPDGMQVALFGLAAFWGAERKFWKTPGVWSTAVGYAGGYTPKPAPSVMRRHWRTCHTEVVRRDLRSHAKLSYDQFVESFSGRATIPRSECARATTPGASIARPSIRTATSRRAKPPRRTSATLSRGAGSRGSRPHHHRDAPPRRNRFLFRRGLSPAVSAQEPRRILRAGRHRRLLPHRPRHLMLSALFGASTFADAVAGGAGARGVGEAFLGGYRAALRRLVPDLPRDRAVCLCASEEVGGAHPRAIATTLSTLKKTEERLAARRQEEVGDRRAARRPVAGGGLY